MAQPLPKQKEQKLKKVEKKSSGMFGSIRNFFSKAPETEPKKADSGVGKPERK